MWDGRRVMQDLSGFRESAAPQAAPRQAAGVRAPRPPPPEPAELPPVSGPLKDVLGFVRRPFGPVDAANAPYQAEPHASARSCLLQVLSEGDRPVVALTGPRGSGRSTLLRGIAAALAPARRVLAIDVRATPEGRTLPQRLCSVAGVTEAGGDEIKRVLDRLDEERRQGPRPLVVLDGVQVPHPSTTGLAAIVGAAVTTRGFQLLLCGEPGLMDALARTGVDLRGQRPAEVALPPLDADQVASFVRSWLRATRPREAQPLVVSQDALLLLARRSEGLMLRIGTLAENMLVLAAAEKRRTVTAWHAWAASDRERWSGRPAASLPIRPAEWPTREALEVLDACRKAAGLPPWPRMEPG
jgi:type II secretory pathway predicted ATPase ExeA